jgi:hypothetical protein
MAKTTESVTQDIMNVEFTDTSKAKMLMILATKKIKIIVEKLQR